MTHVSTLKPKRRSGRRSFRLPLDVVPAERKGRQQEVFERAKAIAEAKVRAIANRYAQVPTPREISDLLEVSRGFLSVLWHAGSEPPPNIAEKALAFALQEVFVALTEPGLRRLNVDELGYRNAQEAEALTTGGANAVRRLAKDIEREAMMQCALGSFNTCITKLYNAPPESFFFRKLAYSGTDGKRAAALLQVAMWLHAKCLAAEPHTFKDQLIARSAAIPPKRFVETVYGRNDRAKVAAIRRARQRVKSKFPNLDEVAEIAREQTTRRGRPILPKRRT